MVAEGTFQCSHCESLGEISFSCFQREHQNLNALAKIWVRNLPDGFTEIGVKNLFLTVGKPACISYNPRNNSALVEFNCMNEAELAVRDLHGKPPYNLKVTIANSKFQNLANKNKDQETESKGNDVWDFSQQEESKSGMQCVVEENCTKPNEKVSHVKYILKHLDYDPSVRMRQKKLDFKTEYECVSFGRGYLFRGKTDNFVGGLQKFESTAGKYKEKEMMRFYCENCQALTTKICGRCFASYCSKVCLSDSGIDHKTCDGFSDGSVRQSTRLGSNSDETSDHSSKMPLKSGCTVVISTYLTMQTVFVRRIDEPWEEKFSRLCNDVAAEAFKGKGLEKSCEAGDLVIAKYHEDLSYYRARVISVKEKVNLYFIDFGNAQQTDLEDLKPLPDHLKSVAAFAVKVHLKDVSGESSLDSVNYYNTLTADRVPLIIDFDSATSEVVLTEKESKAVVNATVAVHALPSWKREGFVFSKSGEVFYLDSMKRGQLEIGSTCNLILSHFDEEEFRDSETFWVTKTETDDFLHANSQMYLGMREYCEYLKNDFYLPRVNELCLAKEGGEWHRCVNLRSNKTTCCLFFLDVGHCSLIGTNNIRKMIEDFVEVPSQAICCTFPDDPKLKRNKEIQSVASKYLKESLGRTIESALVLKLSGDSYCLSIPEIEESCREGNVFKTVFRQCNK